MNWFVEAALLYAIVLWTTFNWYMAAGIAIIYVVLKGIYMVYSANKAMTMLTNSIAEMLPEDNKKKRK